MSGPAYYTGTMAVAKNEDWAVSFTYQTSDEIPVPIDLTGSSLAMQIRVGEADHTALVSLSTENGGIIITSAVDGEFEIIIARATTTGQTQSSVHLVAGQAYVADLVRTTIDGSIERILDVTVSVVEGTTR